MGDDAVDLVIRDDERLRRRIKPPRGAEKTWVLREGVWRAASYSLKDPEGSSFSRERYTSVQELLEALRLQGIDPTGWGVAEVVAEDARRLGFEVVAMSTDADRGHCEVRAPDGLGRGAWSRLAVFAPMIARMAPDGRIVEHGFDAAWGGSM